MGRPGEGTGKKGSACGGEDPSVAPGRPLSRSGRKDKGRKESGAGRLTLSSAGTGESGNEGKGIARGKHAREGKVNK